MENSPTTSQQPATQKKALVFLYLLAILSIGFAYPQNPLYNSNQNTYFLHGLAQSGASPLHADWLAQTADPTPLFSFLVKSTVTFLHPNAFYIFQGVLVSLFLYSCPEIASLKQKILFSL